ncbi:hypothetical protein KCV00_g165, partial [Aureobasidium melanogenum]
MAARNHRFRTSRSPWASQVARRIERRFTPEDRAVSIGGFVTPRIAYVTETLPKPHKRPLSSRPPASKPRCCFLSWAVLVYILPPSRLFGTTTSLQLYRHAGVICKKDNSSPFAFAPCSTNQATIGDEVVCTRLDFRLPVPPSFITLTRLILASVVCQQLLRCMIAQSSYNNRCLVLVQPLSVYVSPVCNTSETTHTTILCVSMDLDSLNYWWTDLRSLLYEYEGCQLEFGKRSETSRDLSISKFQQRTFHLPPSSCALLWILASVHEKSCRVGVSQSDNRSLESRAASNKLLLRPIEQSRDSRAREFSIDVSLWHSAICSYSVRPSSHREIYYLIQLAASSNPYSSFRS